MNVPRISAKFETTLALGVDPGDVTATLLSALDNDGTTLPTGTYGLVVDESNSSVEYVEVTITDTAVTAVKSFSVTALTEVSGFANKHRAGAEVKITDFTILGRLEKIFRGTQDLDSSVPLAYDIAPTLSANEQIATVGYVLSVVTGGAVTFNKNVIDGAAGEALTSGDWVYLKESDGRWYKTDASDKLKSKNVKIGKALGTQASVGDNVPGGVFIGGLETVGTYVAGTKYYLSNTAGAASTSAGDNEVLLGIGDENTDLVFVNLYDPEAVTSDEKDALAGTVGTPNEDNKYVTDNNMTSYGTDQTQTTDDGSVEFGEADATTKKNKIAQSFKPTKAKIRGVNLRKEADTGTFAGTVTVALQLDSSGEPDGSDLATVALTSGKFGVSADSDIEALFSSEYTMDTSKTYWIVVTSSTADNTNHPNIARNSAGGYSDGTLKYNNTTDGWVEISGYDLYFETLEGVNNQGVETDSSGKIAKKFFDRAKVPVPVKSQILNEYTDTYVEHRGTFCSEQDGSAFWQTYGISGYNVDIRRYERDVFGEFKQTHSQGTYITNSASSSQAYYQTIVLGDYVYTLYRKQTTNDLACIRADKADLTNVTTMTVPSIAIANYVHAWTDGQYIYFNPSGVNTTYKLSVSGTTLTTEDSGTCGSTIYGITSVNSNIYDGENIYIVYGISNNIYVIKIDDLYGNSVTSAGYSYTDYPPNQYSGTSNIANQEYTAINIDKDYMYLVRSGQINDGGSTSIYGFQMYPYIK